MRRVVPTARCPPLESGARSDGGYRCGHAPCQCTTMPGGDECSDHCREAAASGQSEVGPCGCGHVVRKSNPGSDLREGGQ